MCLFSLFIVLILTPSIFDNIMETKIAQRMFPNVHGKEEGMPPKFKFSREEVVKAALDVLRKGGSDSVTARAVGEKLGASSKVIFGLFKNMEELRNEVMKAGYGLYYDYLKEDMEKNVYPQYKASGMAYIRFAKEERELFKFLFMRDRSKENYVENWADIDDIVSIIQKNLGLDREDARMFHVEMWIFVHGIAVMLVTSYSNWSEENISELLSIAYDGIKRHYTDKK